jgi:hypothetical protein
MSAVAALGVLLASGCSGTGSPGVKRPQPSSVVSTGPTSTLLPSQPSTTFLAQSGTPVALRPVATFPGVNGAANRVAIWSHYLAFAGSSTPNSRSPTADEVEVIDLTTGQRRAVARVQAGGEVDNTIGVGDAVAWIELLQVPTDTQRAVQWRLRAADLTSGLQWTIASSEARRDLDVPYPVVGDGLISWTQPGTTGTDLYTAHLSPADPGKRVIAGFLGSYPAHLCGGKFVFTQWVDLNGRPVNHGPANDSDESIVTGVAVADMTGQVKVLPGSVHPPQRAIVNSCDDSTVVWTLQRPADPVSADPKSLWSAPLAGGPSPTQIAGPNHGNAAVADGFVAYLDNAQASLVIQPNRPEVPTTVEQHPFIPAGVYFDGLRMAFGTTLADGSPTVRVVQVG